MKRIRVVAAGLCALGAVVSLSVRLVAQTRATSFAVGAESVERLREWDTRVEQMTGAGELRQRDVNGDPLLPGRQHERFQQVYRGVPVWGADITRQSERGVTISIFGSIYDGIAIDTTPALTPEDARDAIARLSGVDLGGRLPDLLILPLDGGGYALTYRDQAISADQASVYFIDAMDGRLRLKYSLLEHQSAIVSGIGVLGDTKK